MRLRHGITLIELLVVIAINPGPSVPSDAAYLSGFAGAAEFKLGPGLFDNEGHTEWCNSPVHESGFTTTFGPNQRVEYLHSDGQTYDVDFNSRDEGRLLRTLLECRSRSLTETNENARRLVDAHRANGQQTDDVTLLLLEFEEFAPLENTASNQLQGFIH